MVMVNGKWCKWCDYQICFAQAKNITNHICTKHIDVQHYFICLKLASDKISLKYYKMKDMKANMLTKSLARKRH